MRRTKEQTEIEVKLFKVYEKDNKWFGHRFCYNCNKKIKHEAQEKCLVLRNIRNAEKENRCCNICCRLGDKNHFYGKTHSKDSKSKISTSRTGKACGSGNAMSNPKHRKKVSDVLKKKYDSGELDFLKKIQKETMIRSLIQGKLKTAPISKAEKEIKKELENNGFSVKSQFLIETLKFDLFLTEHNTLIEFNGDYWHCNPEKYDRDFLNKKKNLYAWQLWEKDKFKKELAEKNGYKFFVIWEKDYNINKINEIKKIINKL